MANPIEMLRVLVEGINEKARQNTFGADYREKQLARDRSELDNAIAQAQVHHVARADETLGRLARAKYPTLDPEQAIEQYQADQLQQRTELDRRGSEAAIDLHEAQAEHYRQPPEPAASKGWGKITTAKGVFAFNPNTGTLGPRLGDAPPHQGPNLSIPWRATTDPYGNLTGYIDKGGRAQQIDNPTGQTLRTGAIPVGEQKDLGNYAQVEATLAKIESTLSRVENTSWMHPIDKSMALGQFQADAQGLGGIVLGRAAGEVGVFTNQDRAVYARVIAPSLAAVAAGSLGTDEARRRISEARRWISGVKQRAADRFQSRYGFVPDELVGEEDNALDTEAPDLMPPTARTPTPSQPAPLRGRRPAPKSIDATLDNLFGKRH